VSAMIRGVGIGILLALMIVFFSPQPLAQDADRALPQDLVLVPRAQITAYAQEMSKLQAERDEALHVVNTLRASTQCVWWKARYF
jgi:hypothetical protein